MANGRMNLTLERGDRSVWDDPGLRGALSTRDAERWMTAAVGSTLTILGARQRGLAGGLIAAAGSILAIRAAMGHHDMAAARRAVDRAMKEHGWLVDDVVESASEESFPASDAPSWTADSGATINR